MNLDLSIIGAHFVVGLGGTTLLAEEKILLQELQPAGIILFAHNIDRQSPKWISSLKQLIAQAKSAIGREDFLVGVDHEGGAVHRLIPPVTHFPAAQCWKSHTPEIALAMARELRALNINLSFAPVLDVDYEPNNPIIGKRALGSTAAAVSQHGKEFFKAMNSCGVLTCGKHFPGHGGTTKDSHLELPTLAATRNDIFKRDLYPFIELIAAGMPMIMTAHVLYPELDPNLPATLSHKILHDLLRIQLGFQGVIISDALEMKALANISPENIGTACFEATVDLLLVAQPKGILPVVQAKMHALSLIDEIDRHALLESTLGQSARRITQLYSHLSTIQRNELACAYDEQVIGCESHQKLCAAIKT